MVDSCQGEKAFLPNCFTAVLVVFLLQGTQRGGTRLATVVHTDIRGLVTAWLFFVAELPLSIFVSSANGFIK